MAAVKMTSILMASALLLLAVLNCCNSMCYASVPSHRSDPYPHLNPAPSPSPSQGVRAAYWPSFNGFPASSINTSYFTHIYYAFLLPDPATYELVIEPLDQQQLPEFINALRAKSPLVKTMLSIGGGGNNATVFSLMSSNQLTRSVFINSSIEIARKYGFNGLDLDWEWPETAVDMSNLALLYKEWQEVMLIEANLTNKPRLLLTSAVYYASKFSSWGEPRSYPGQAMATYLDWINPMCFDYHGSWANFTGPNAALYDPNGILSTDYGVRSWIQAGIPTKKIVIGLPIYGHTWTLQDPKKTGIGAPATKGGPGDGTLSYSQVIDFNRENNATVKYDNISVSYYSYAGYSWIGYDDVDSIELKVQFARSRSLGGYFFWAIGLDLDWALTKSASYAWEK